MTSLSVSCFAVHVSVSLLVCLSVVSAAAGAHSDTVTGALTTDVHIRTINHIILTRLIGVFPSISRPGQRGILSAAKQV